MSSMSVRGSLTFPGFPCCDLSARTLPGKVSKVDIMVAVPVPRSQQLDKSFASVCSGYSFTGHSIGCKLNACHLNGITFDGLFGRRVERRKFIKNRRCKNYEDDLKIYYAEN